MSRNLAASVHQRLLNFARAENRPFGEVLQRFVLERFLYRLGASSYRDQFILKGGLMLGVWQPVFSRPTRDIDLLGRAPDTIEYLGAAIQAVCQTPVTDDGLRFAADKISGEQIMEAGNYRGVRIKLYAYLGKSRIPVQIDIGFGDAVIPDPVLVKLPVILDFPSPELQGYSKESAIAEKLQAMVYLGEINSRMKDFYDIWLLANRFNFNGQLLSRAIAETFRRRQTTTSPDALAFCRAFKKDEGKQAQWTAFVQRHNLTNTPAALSEVVQNIEGFIFPVLQSLSEGKSFERRWQSGVWRNP